MSKPPRVELLDNESPTTSARIIADDNKIEYEVDTRGRRIGVKKIKLVNAHRLARVVGGETASNNVAYLQVLSVASVVEIDGEMIPQPGTNLQVEALMTRLDFDGLTAAMKALERLSPKKEDEAEIKN